ncbi:MAG: peptide chain release factor-like protein [Verrucomicrobiae bacterium]|nr:peptide chain release factor-like protein [Verrucomicrobiae bacterium]
MRAFPVTPRKQDALHRRMLALGVREEEIEEGFMRAGGRGGQKLNKTSSAVALFHRPTGIRVRCEASRSQALNRFLARRLLLDRIEERRRGFVAAARDAAEKIRRRKRRRSRRAKERMLEGKRRQSERKSQRARVEW